MFPSRKTSPATIVADTRRPLRTLLAISSVLLALGSTAALAQQSTLGLKLGVQPWTPLTNDDTVQFPVNDPTLISDELNKGWQNYSQKLQDTIKAELGTADLAAKGVTFYDINLSLTQPLLTVDQLKGSGVPSDPYQVALHINLNNEGIDMSATQPTVLGSYADPRCHAEFDAVLSLQLTIQNTPGAAFSSSQTQEGSEPIAQITRFDFGGKNTVCDVASAIVDIAGFKDKITDLVTKKDGAVNKPLGNAARDLLTGAITDLNAAVAPYQHPELNLLILRAWLVNQGGGQQIVLNLAPRAPLPDPTAGKGVMGGLITVANAGGIKTGTSNGSVSCAQLPVTVSRITGPRPMISPAGTLGAQPLEALNVKTSCDTPDGSVLPNQQKTYRITGMSALFPQIVTFTSVSSHCSASEAGVKHGIDVKTEWTQGVVMAQHLLDRHNLTASVLTIVCGGDAAVLQDPRDRFLKYMLEQEASNPDPYTINVIRQYLTSQGMSLNLLKTLPQPQLQLPATQQTRSAPPPSPACTPNQYADAPAFGRATQQLNVRIGDNTTCKLIGQLRAGSTVHILSCVLANGAPSNWCKIEFQDNIGYVAKRLLVQGDISAGDDDTPPVVLQRQPRNGGRFPSDDGYPGDYNPNGDGNAPTNYDHPNADQPNDGMPNADTGDCLYLRGRMICNTTAAQ